MRTIATRHLVMEGGLSGRTTECRYCRYHAPKVRCHGNHFWFSIYGVHIGATWLIRLNRRCAPAMRHYVKLLWPLVLFLYEISREPLNGFAPNSQGRRVWSLARTSLNVKVKGHGHQGQKTAFSVLSVTCVRFMFGKTSLASSMEFCFCSPK